MTERERIRTAYDLLHQARNAWHQARELPTPAWGAITAEAIEGRLGEAARKALANTYACIGTSYSPELAAIAACIRELLDDKEVHYVDQR